jgi:competence ComEA-like helix-hairpin-helix protein
MADPSQSAMPRVDLNTADREALCQLPGIGPALAERIIERRQSVGPFAAVSDITSVKGITRAMYERLAGQAHVSIPTPEAPPNSPEPVVIVGPPPVREPPPLVEPPLALVPKPAPAEQALPPPPPPQPQPPPAARRDWTALVGMTMLGAFLGAMLALLALAGMNEGTLALNERAQVLDLTSRNEALSSRADALQTEVDSLRARLSVLEGLTTRLDDAEAALTEMTTALDAVETDVAALDVRAEALSADVAQVRVAAERFDGFIQGLQALLSDLAAAPQPTSTAPPPTRTPAASATHAQLTSTPIAP